MIELKNVTKYYKTKKGKHFVFKNVSFTIPEKRNVAIIGRNGTGKSTLIRLLGKTDIPNEGEIITNKTISFPIGFSGGFQGSLTSSENIKFICRVYGCNREETAEKIRFVRDFAEIGKYFDLPVSSYSSGMRARVAFGLSMAFDFDYYLADEVLAVGDANFKEKSYKVFQEKREKANILLVAHSATVLRSMCDSAIVLKNNELTFYDELEEGLKVYFSSLS